MMIFILTKRIMEEKWIHVWHRPRSIYLIGICRDWILVPLLKMMG